MSTDDPNAGLRLAWADYIGLVTFYEGQPDREKMMGPLWVIKTDLQERFTKAGVPIPEDK